MATKVKLVLLAGSSGMNLARQLQEAGAYMDLLQGEDGVPKVLLGMNGTPILNYWLTAIADCPRLLPLHEKVFIVTNHEMHPLLEHWANSPELSRGGFPASNIIDSGASGGATPGSVVDLATFLRTTGDADAPSASHYVAIEADSILEPGFNLRRVIEHAIVRGKDCVAAMLAPPGAPLAPHHTVLALEGVSTDPESAETEALFAGTTRRNGSGAMTLLGPMGPTLPTTSLATAMMGGGGGTTVGPSPAPRTAAVDVDPPHGAVSDGRVPVLAPIVVLRATSLPVVLSAAEEWANNNSNGNRDHASSSSSQGKQLGRLVARLVNNNNSTVCALPVSMCFSLATLASLRLASEFYAFYLSETTAPPKGEAAKALIGAQRLDAINSAKTPGMTGAQAVAAAASAAAAAAAGTARGMWLEFWERWVTNLSRGGGGYGIGGVGGVSAANPAYSQMPRRFADVTTRRHAPRAQHPCYMTTNNDYGLKKPTQLDMPNTYASSSQAFTNTFPAHPEKTSALITSVTRSKVHKLLDEF